MSASSADSGTVSAQRGVATVEAILILPLLLLLTGAVAELGRAFVQYTVLAQATRDAARHVASRALTNTTGLATLSGTLVNEARNVLLYGTAVAGTQPRLPGLRPEQVAVALSGGDITVSVEYPYRSLFGGGLPTFGLAPRGAAGYVMSTSLTMRPL